jgi:hypothetical protein
MRIIEVQLLYDAPEREIARSISSFSGGRECGNVDLDAVEKVQIQTTNLRVGRSNRSGRATSEYASGAESRRLSAQVKRLCCRSSPARLRRGNQRFRRYAPVAVQPPGHPRREGTLPRQDVGCALARAEETAKIRLVISAGFHAVTDRVDCILRLDRPALALVVFDD